MGAVDGVGRRDPLAVVVDLGVEANGADNVAAGERGVCGAFDEELEDGVGAVPSAGEEPGGFCVTVDGGAAGDSVFVSDFVGTAPVEEFALDQRAVGVAAHGAGALMASGVDGARFLASSTASVDRLHFFPSLPFWPVEPSRRP